MTTSATPPPFAIYIHLPWCIQKCPYCDFNSHTQPATLPETQYVSALQTEWQRLQPKTHGRTLKSIFFGGGTPSLFSGKAIETLISMITANVRTDEHLEITLEANPGTAERQYFNDYQTAGVNRLSLGAQSFNPTHLKALGRIHNDEDIPRAVELAHQAGIDNLNLDLMYALPKQTLAEALSDVQHAIDLAPNHISHYQLTLEPNTYFAKHPPTLPSHDHSVDMQDACQSLLADHQFKQYEVSAFAREQQTCWHNLNYWHFGDYLGLGAGAHSKWTEGDAITRWHNQRHPQQYLKQPEAAASQAQTSNTQDVMFEYMLGQLRLTTPLSLKHFTQVTHLPSTTLLPSLSACAQHGWMQALDQDQWQTTELGWQFLNEVQAHFLPTTDKRASGTQNA